MQVLFSYELSHDTPKTRAPFFMFYSEWSVFGRSKSNLWGEVQMKARTYFISNFLARGLWDLENVPYSRMLKPYKNTLCPFLIFFGSSSVHYILRSCWNILLARACGKNWSAQCLVSVRLPCSPTGNSKGTLLPQGSQDWAPHTHLLRSFQLSFRALRTTVIDSW